MGKKIKILYQFATAKLKTPNGDKEVLKRKKFLEKNIGTNTTIKLSIPNKGPGTIESDFDEAMATPNVIESIIAAEKKGYDVAIISCFSDPGLEACREKVNIPIVGSGENAILLSAQLGNKFSILSPLHSNSFSFNKRIFSMGLEKKYCSTRGIGMSVLDLAKDRKKTLNKILSIGKAAINKDGGGSQYTFLEAIHMDCALVLNRKWVEGVKTPFKHGVNCYVVDDEEGLAKLLNSNPNTTQVVKNAKKLLRPHLLGTGW